MKFSDLLLEGRKEDFLSKYSKKFSNEQLNRIADLIIPKYLDWAGKAIDAINFDDNLSKSKIFWSF